MLFLVDRRAKMQVQGAVYPCLEENIDTVKIGYGRCIHHSWGQVQDSGVKPVMRKGRNQFEF